MLKPREYTISDPAASTACGLPAREYGMLVCTDDDGARITLVGDAEYVRMPRDAPRTVLADLEVSAEVFPIRGTAGRTSG